MSTMRQRAIEIIDAEYYNDKTFIRRLKRKIKYCDLTCKSLLNNSLTYHCPFPRIEHKYEYSDGTMLKSCCSCEYFFKGSYRPRCGCTLIDRRVITKNQAINGLRIFKNVMKRYLAEMEEQSHASKDAR